MGYSVISRSIQHATTCLLLVRLTAHESATARPWQELVQPIGDLLINPPESALAVNEYLMRLDPSITPATFPFKLSTDVTKIRTSELQQFVRFYNESAGSFPVGSWIVRASQLRGKTRAEIRDLLALPAPATHFTLVRVPEGITVYTGEAGAIEGWGNGGATQSKMMGPPFVPVSNFINRQLLSDCFLCYRDLARPGSGQQIAVVLDRNQPVAYTPLDTLYNNLDLLYYAPAPGALQQALQSLSGEILTGSQTTALAITSSLVDQVQRMASLDHNPAGPSPKEQAAPRHRSRIWTSAGGGQARLLGADNSATIHYSGELLQVGVDHQPNTATRIGLAIGLAESRYGLDAVTGQGSLEGFSVAGFVVGNLKPVHLSAIAAYARTQTQVNRSLAIGELSSSLQASFGTNLYAIRLEASTPRPSGGSYLSPFLAFQPTLGEQAGFTERVNQTTASVNPGLQVQPRSYSALPLSVGIHLGTSWENPKGWTVRPKASVSFVHDFSTTRQLDAALTLLPEQPFTITGTPGAANAANVSLQLTAEHASGLAAFAALDAQLTNRGSGLLASGGLRYRF